MLLCLPPHPQVSRMVFFITSFGLVSHFCSQADILSWLHQKRGENSWAILLPLSCSDLLAPPDAVQLFTVCTVSDIATPLLSSLLHGLTWFLRTMSLELQSCFVAPSRQQQQQKGRGAKAAAGQRGQRKQRRELNSSNFSLSCWVFLCVMTICGS